MIDYVDNFLPKKIYQDSLNLLRKYDTNRNYLNFQGKRKYVSNRHYITQKSSNEEKQLANFFNQKYQIENSLLKIELVNEDKGFYLEKHFDHKEKKFNIVIYIEGDIESGTTFNVDNVDKKIDFVPNRALFFGSDVEHWVDKIKSKRRVLLVTWVDKKLWREVENCYA